MADEIDPHHLVLIMNAQYGSRLQDGAPRRQDTRNYIIKNGVGNDFQMYQLLDALASLGVRKPKGEVVALALSMGSNGKEVKLTISENRGVFEGLDPYLRDVWNGLQALSSAYASSNEQHETGDIFLPLKTQVYRAVSRHTLSKFLKRTQGNLESLLEFTDCLVKYRETSYPKGFDENLTRLASELVKITLFLQGLRDGRPEGDEWSSIFKTSILVREEAAVVLSAEDNLGCENLAEELYNSTSKLYISLSPKAVFLLYSQCRDIFKTDCSFILPKF